MDRVEQKARGNEKMLNDIFESLGRRSREMKDLYDALADQEGTVDMRLDALEEKTREFSNFGGILKSKLDGLLQRVEELEESKALLDVTTMVLSYCFLDRFLKTFFIKLLYSHLCCYQFLLSLLTTFKDFKRDNENETHAIH